jgi:hypothetical protein
MKRQLQNDLTGETVSTNICMHFRTSMRVAEEQSLSCPTCTCTRDENREAENDALTVTGAGAAYVVFHRHKRDGVGEGEDHEELSKTSLT